MMDELAHDQTAEVPEQPVSSVPPPVWRRRPVQLLAGLVAVAAAIGGYAAASSSPAQIHVRGTLALAYGGFVLGSDGCQGDGGFGDITPGTAVTVAGGTGQTLGIGALGGGQEDENSACVFPFDVAVPGGQSVYTVTISHRGTQTFTPAQVASGITLTLG